MFTSLLGIRIVILVGDTVPLPAPYDLTSALQQLEVTSDSSQGDGFQITFNLARNGLADYGLIQKGTVAPMKRIIIGVLMGARPEVLIDGVITHHQFNPGTEPGQATLTVTGRDLTALMDLEEKNAEFPNQSDFMIATRVLSAYAKHGIAPMAMPTADFPISLNRIPRQHETDLQFLKRLAGRNGFVFYLEPLTFGASQAYIGPASRVGLPQPALSMNLGSTSNLKSITFANDALALTGERGVFLEPITKTSIPIPVLPSLRLPPLVARPATPNRIRLQRDTANQSPTRAATGLLAAATNAPDPVTADGEVDSVRYGHVLRARKLVGVRGVGLTHDGLWYVRRVTHTVSRTDYSQRFSLSREGDFTLTPLLPT